jgi:endonuclease/exonuclease/phosphatase family metal-dependent hydrolase
MSWNVNKSSNREGRIEDQIAVIREHDVDVLFLQEVRYGADMKWLEVWQDGLEELGLASIEHSCEWAAELAESTVPPHGDIGHDNGHITAVSGDWDLRRNEQLIRPRLERTDRSKFDTNFPEKILVTEVDTSDIEIECWNVRAVPGRSWGDEKIKIFETVYERLAEAGSEMRLLAGDFNSPRRELPDGQAIPFGYDKDADVRDKWVSAELNVLKGLGHLDMVDAFRYVHGYGEIGVKDTSWKSKRFDHIFASSSLRPSRCYYESVDCSDHAPIIADLEA